MENAVERLRAAQNRSLVAQLKEFQSNPKSLIFVSLAEEYRKENLPDLALDILREGAEFHPEMPSAMLVEARCYVDQKKFSDALNLLKRLIQINPEHWKAHKLQANIYLSLGQRSAAVRALDKVLQIYPQDQEAQRTLQEIKTLAAGRHSEVIPSQLEEPRIIDKPGKIEEFQVSTFSEALPKVQAEVSASIEPEIVEEDFEPTFATRTIAELYLRQGLSTKAKKVLKQLLQQDPSNDWAKSVLQELKTDGIVLSNSVGHEYKSQRNRLETKLKYLERLLAAFRVRRSDVRNW